MDWDKFFDKAILCVDCPLSDECDKQPKDMSCADFLRRKYDADMLSGFADEIDSIRDELEHIGDAVEAMCDRHHQEFGSSLPHDIKSLVRKLEDIWQRIGGE